MIANNFLDLLARKILKRCTQNEARRGVWLRKMARLPGSRVAVEPRAAVDANWALDAQAVAESV